MPRANHTATISAGMTTRKAQRQPNRPPTRPPKAGAIEAERLVPVTQIPIARAWRSGATEVRRIAIDAGVSKAAATPCRARAPIRKSADGASPTSSVATMKATRPTCNIRLWPQTSPITPAGSTNAVIVIR